MIRLLSNLVGLAGDILQVLTHILKLIQTRIPAPDQSGLLETVDKGPSLIDEAVHTNKLLFQQNEILKKQQRVLVGVQQRLDDMHEVLLRTNNLMHEVLLRTNNLMHEELVHLLREPLLDKYQVMEKLRISDTTYRRYVKNGRLQPMGLEKIDWYFGRDVIKALRENRRKGKG